MPFQWEKKSNVFWENHILCILSNTKAKAKQTTSLLVLPFSVASRSAAAAAHSQTALLFIHSAAEPEPAAAKQLSTAPPLPGLAWSCCSALCSVKLCYCSFSVVWDVQGSVSPGQRWTLWTAWQWSNPPHHDTRRNRRKLSCTVAAYTQQYDA